MPPPDAPDVHSDSGSNEPKPYDFGRLMRQSFPNQNLPTLRDLLDRTPPQNLGYEQAVIGAMLLDTKALHICCALLNLTDFYRPAHGVIFAAIDSLRRKGEPVDVLTVSTRLRYRRVDDSWAIHFSAKAGDETLYDAVGGAPTLIHCVNALPAAANAEYYAREVKKLSARRKIGENLTVLYAMAGDEGDNWQQMAELIRHTLAYIDYVQSIEQSIESPQANGVVATIPDSAHFVTGP